MKKETSHPWEASGIGVKKAQKKFRTPWELWRANLLVSLRTVAPSLTLATLALPMPQSGCCFKFGPKKTPIPVGALFQLWTKDPYSTGICPLCQGTVVATAFGGLLNTGGYKGQCLQCAAPMFRRIGGLGSVQHHVRPFLEGTPWYLSGAVFGGAISSDGKALAKVLGMAKPPKNMEKAVPIVKVGKNRLPTLNVEIVEKS